MQLILNNESEDEHLVLTENDGTYNCWLLVDKLRSLISLRVKLEKL